MKLEVSKLINVRPIKSFGLIMFFLAVSFLTISQVQVAPSIDWKKDHRFPHYPIDSTGSIQWISHDDFSGEDWWHSITAIYDSVVTDSQIGYIAVGFSHFEDYHNGDTTITPVPWLYDEVSGGQGGVINDVAGTECLPFFAIPNPPYDSNLAGSQMQTVGYYNMTGSMLWCRVINQGNLQYVVQSNDRKSFTAVGYTNAIKDRKHHQWTNPGGEFLAFNPTSGSPNNTFNGWSGNGLVSSERRANVSVINIDHSGQINWNYIYGNEDFGATGSLAWKNTGIGFGICAGPDTGSAQTYRIVGRTRILNDSTGAQIIERSMFILDIAQNGYINWHDSPYSTGILNSVATKVVRNPSSSGEYYITGFKSWSGASQTHISLLCYPNGSQSDSWRKLITDTTDTFAGGFVLAGNDDACGGWTMDFDYQGNLLLGALINGDANPFRQIGNYANPRIYTIIPDTTQFGGFARNPIPNSNTFDRFGTHDLKIALAATADNGFAICSSRESDNPWPTKSAFETAFPSLNIPGICGWGINSLAGKFWDSDAVVAKFQDDGNGQRELKWETEIDSDNPRENYPGDMKKRECIFDITVASDGGIVFTGNVSDNHDDYYLVKLMDDCDDSIDITISVMPYCANDSALILVASASGGSSPYSYLWPDSTSNDSVYINSSGDYSVTVTDQNGCQPIGYKSINLPDSNIYLDSIEIANPSCYGDTNGFIFVQTFGGVAPYGYAWSNGQSSQLDSNLNGGSYFLTITDSFGCVFLDTFVLNDPSQLLVTVSASEDTICLGDTIDLNSSPSGGTTPYAYLWSNASTIQNQSSLVLVSDSTFVLTVTDSTGCTTVDTVSIVVNPLPTLSFTSVEVWRYAKDFPLNHAEPSGGSYSSIGMGLSSFVYTLSGQPWFKLSSPTTISPNSLPIVPITYTYSDSLGCMSTITDTFYVYTDCGTNTGGSPPVITGGYSAATKFPKGLASEGESVIEDLVNNELSDVFFVGSFSGKTQIGHRIFESVDGSTDIVVGMYDGDATGNDAGCGLVWLETFGDSGEDFGHAVEVENPLNTKDIYIAGQTEDGYGFGFLTNNTNSAKGYVLEIDYFSGTYVTTPWGSIIGPNDQAPNDINDIAITSGGELGFAGWADYSTYNLNFAGSTYSGGFGTDALVGVFDNTGNEAAIAMVQDAQDGFGYAIETSGQDFLMVGKSWDYSSNTLTGVNPFGLGNLTYASSYDHILLTRFQSPYTTLEACLIGNSYDNAAYGIDGALNGTSDYIVTGKLKGTVDFGCGNVTSVYYNSAYTEDAFAFKMSSSGGCTFSIALGDDGDDHSEVAHVHQAGNIYVAAALENSSGIERENLYELNTSSGSVITSQVLAQGAPADYGVHGLASNIGWSSGDHVILSCGFFNDSLALNDTIYETGNDADGFIARVAFGSGSASAFKFGEGEVESDNGESTTTTFIVYPNPADNTLHYFLESVATVSAYDAAGKRMYHAARTEGLQRLDVSTWSRGVYLLTIDALSGHKTVRFVLE